MNSSQPAVNYVRGREVPRGYSLHMSVLKSSLYSFFCTCIIPCKLCKTPRFIDISIKMHIAPQKLHYHLKIKHAGHVVFDIRRVTTCE
jgi:hypothetical protein